MKTLYDLTAVNGPTTPLVLSDGTPVTFSKITSRDRIQVRLPDSHPFAAGQENGRIFRRDGTHYKDATDLTLAVASEAPAAAAAPANDNSVVGRATGFLIDGDETRYNSLSDAKGEALDVFADTGDDVTIFALVPVGRVGFTQLAA